MEGRARPCSPRAGSGVCLVRVPCEGLAVSLATHMPGLTDPSPSCLRASTSHCEVTGRGHLALAPRRAFAGWLPCTSRHWEPAARAGPASPVPYQKHCSTAGAKSGVCRGQGTASFLSCGVWGTPIPEGAEEDMSGVAMGWAAPCQRHPQVCGEPPAPSWLPLPSPSCLTEL